MLPEGRMVGMPDGAVSDPSNRVIVWDHRRTPGCADTTNYTNNPRPPYTPCQGVSGSETHYPTRHNGGLDMLYYDGHVKWQQPGKLRVADFRERGYSPSVPGTRASSPLAKTPLVRSSWVCCSPAVLWHNHHRTAALRRSSGAAMPAEYATGGPP
jgi:prepilin-type processing-associated H-X9-DG protein